MFCYYISIFHFFYPCNEPLTCAELIHLLISHIYIWYPPRLTFQANLVVFIVFFLTFWDSKAYGIFWWSILFPSQPSRSTSDPKKASWIRRPSALNLESKEVGLKKFFLSLESWILNPDTWNSISHQKLQFLANDRPVC